MIAFGQIKHDGSKALFFANKKEAKKTPVIYIKPAKPPVAQIAKSFLVTFFQKSNGLRLILLRVFNL